MYTPNSEEQQPPTPPGDNTAQAESNPAAGSATNLTSPADRPFTTTHDNAPSGTTANSKQKDSSKPQFDAQGRALNPRSCITCRKRKVKCDKLNPCSNCTRAHIECVFPAPGRAPRKVRKVTEGRDKELLERLRRLEGVVKGLGVELPGPDAEDKDGQKDEESRHIDGIGENGVAQAALGGSGTQSFHDVEAIERIKWVEDKQEGRFEDRFGRLVINEGKSRYVNSSFWANLSNEVEDLKEILNQSSEDEEDGASPLSNGTTNGPLNNQGWMFGFNSQSVNMLSLHPPAAQIRVYWEIYKDRVDPLVKVLHIPSIEPIVLQAASHLSKLSKGFEPMLFTIYYGATTSLSPEDCLAIFSEEKPVLLARYRFGLEQALARANFLTTEETVVLQAFVIFLICLRRNNDARVIWTLTGLIVRIAHTLGVHRDGTHFNLSPFEIEMRRRLWWQICILDIRASEDHGCDPTILEQSFDTKMPLNVNDADVSPEMKDFPMEKQGCTDMSFCLIRFEVANTFRRLNYIPPSAPQACQEALASTTLQDKERWITECHNRLEERYLKHCDMSVPLFWVTATVARLMMSKMWLMVYHPFQRQDGCASVPNETKEKLFITSLENIEYSILLDTEARTMKWGWLFKTYIQWHALAFILSELCHRTTGDLVERAWKAVEKSKDGRWGVKFTDDSTAHHLWRPMRKLYRKAQEARQRGLQEEALAKQMPLPPQRTYSPNANPMFEHPHRPRMTRAPLSQAQLQRFVAGPTYGEVPVDKHELFRSPRTSEASGTEDVEPGDATMLHSAGGVVGLPNGNGMVAQMQAGHPAFNQNFNQSFNQGNVQQPNPEYGASFFPTTQAGLNGFPQTQMGMPGPGVMREDSFASSIGDLGDLDMSVMDTSGDLNWQNWDQLVNQFGMDVDLGAGTTANLGGGNWDMPLGGGNMRMMQGDHF